MDGRVLLRADYVKLHYTWLEVPCLAPLEAEVGWLTLADDGKVMLFEGNLLDPSGTPKFVADNPRDLRCTYYLGLIQWGALRIHFGATSRFVYFTGLRTPPGSGGDIGSTAGTAAALAGQSVLGTIGQGAGLLAQVKNYYVDNPGSLSNSRAARVAWAAVLTGAVPWQQIARNT
jgi:hypothetical protein